MSGREAELKRSRPSASDKTDACRALGSGLGAGLREPLRIATAGRFVTSPRLCNDNIDSSESVEVAFAALDRFGVVPAPEKVWLRTKSRVWDASEIVSSFGRGLRA